MSKLEIIAEVSHGRGFKYMDKDFKIYEIASGVCCPASPMVSYTKYNDSKFYTRISNPSEELYQAFHYLLQPKELIVYEGD